MKYNDLDLFEMTPEKWDGKTREMLVWDDNSPSPFKKIVVGCVLRGNRWMSIDGNYWTYCAEIPTEEKEDAMKLLIDSANEILELKEENEKLKTEIAHFKEENLKLRSQNDIHSIECSLYDKLNQLETENTRLAEKLLISSNCPMAYSMINNKMNKNENDIKCIQMELERLSKHVSELTDKWFIAQRIINQVKGKDYET